MEHLKSCLVCGKDFVTKERNAKYCNLSCSAKARAKEPNKEYICKYCGVAFHPKHHPECITYCSRACAYADKAAKPKEKTIYTHKCIVCDKDFKSQCHTGVYCSDECKKENARRKDKLREASHKVMYQRKCKCCGKVFIPEYGNKRSVFCSIDCGKKAGHRKAKASKRARLKGVAYENINAFEIYERDHWICGICKKPIDKELVFPNPWCVSLDHIIPVNAGGAHIKDNVQAAHFICNTLKGDSLLETVSIRK